MANSVVTTTIDEIVRTVLVEMQLPIHFYMRAASIGIRTVRDLNLGALPTVKAVRLTVDEFNEVDIPADLVDWIRLGQETEKRIRPLGNNENYNRLPNLDADDQQIAYGESSGHTIGVHASFNHYTFGKSVSDYGEINGKMFGMGEPDRNDNFKFIVERGKIAVGKALKEGDVLYMEYVAYNKDEFFSGISVIAAPYIEQSIRYNFARYDRTGRLGDLDREKMNLDNARRRLNAQVNSINKEDLLRVFRKNFKQSIKA